MFLLEKRLVLVQLLDPSCSMVYGKKDCVLRVCQGKTRANHYGREPRFGRTK